MNVYDQAHGLAHAIKASEEFKQYDQAKAKLKENPELEQYFNESGKDGFFVKNKAYILIYRAYSYWNVKMYCTEKNEYDGKFSIKLSKKPDIESGCNEARLELNPQIFHLQG